MHSSGNWHHLYESHISHNQTFIRLWLYGNSDHVYNFKGLYCYFGRSGWDSLCSVVCVWQTFVHLFMINQRLKGYFSPPLLKEKFVILDSSGAWEVHCKYHSLTHLTLNNLFILIKVMVYLKLVPVSLDSRQEFNPGRTLVHCRGSCTHTLTHTLIHANPGPWTCQAAMLPTVPWPYSPMHTSHIQNKIQILCVIHSMTVIIFFNCTHHKID